MTPSPLKSQKGFIRALLDLLWVILLLFFPWPIKNWFSDFLSFFPIQCLEWFLFPFPHDYFLISVSTQFTLKFSPFTDRFNYTNLVHKSVSFMWVQTNISQMFSFVLWQTSSLGLKYVFHHHFLCRNSGNLWWDMITLCLPLAEIFHILMKFFSP